MTESVIKLLHVQKNFGNHAALKDVSFAVYEGDIVGFIGPNGSGKTTTIRILLGMLKATSGKALVFGKDAWQEDLTIHAQVAYVPGDISLWPNLTGGEIIDLLLQLNNQKRSKRTEELIEAFQLDTKKKARTYSKGNRQKVVLITALSQEAALYIFDEPTSGLDPLNERIFQKEISLLKKQKKTVLLSSHILSEVEKMCDKIVVIRAGEIIETGELDKLKHLSVVNISFETQLPVTDIINDERIEKKTIKNHEETEGVFVINRSYLNDIIALLTEKNLVDLSVQPPTLEDLFLRYYGDIRGDHHDDA